MLTPIEITSKFRYEVLAAVSVDRQWKYQRVSGARWSVTHAPTGRRYWVAGLDQARAETADGTAARLLGIDAPLPCGKPLHKGEHAAIVAELTGPDCERMLAELNRQVPFMVEGAAGRVRPNPVPGLPAPYRTLQQMLGVVYGGEPWAWVDALRAVRPDLVPPHLDGARYIHAGS